MLGTISTLATLLAGTYTDTLNTPITLAPASTTTGGAGSFLSNGTSGQTLVIGGPITTGATTGTITLNLGGTNTTGNLVSGGITPSNTGLFVISKTGAGYWTDSATNNFNGTIQVSAGQLTLSGVDNSTTASTASASTVSGGTLILSGTTTVGSLNLSGGYILASGTNTFSGIGSFSGGSFSSTGNATFSSTSATALTITNSIFNASSTTSFAGGVTVTTGGSLTLSGPVSGAGSFTITNNGSATLSGTNTFTGAINLTGGTLTLSGVDTAAGTTTVSGNTANSPYIQPLLTLDFTAGQASILKTTSAFVLGDGVVAIRGTGTQAVAGLTLNGATAGTLSLGTGTLTATGITRNSESTLFVDESLGGTFKIGTTAAVLGYIAVQDANGIGLGLGTAGTITRLIPTASLMSTGNVAATNYKTSGALTTSGNFTINSLTIDTSATGGAGTLDLGGATGTITTSGLIDTGSNPYTIQDGTLLSGFNGNELVVQQFSTGLETISANIGGTSALTKAGSGALLVTASNNFTGVTTVNNGTLIAGRSTVVPSGTTAGFGAIGTGTNNLVVNPGAVLDVNGNFVAAAGVTGSGTILNNAAGTTGTISINTTNAATTATPEFTDGAGTLAVAILNTASSQTSLVGTNTFSGGLTLGGGVLSQLIQLRFNYPAAIGTGTIILNGGNFLPNTTTGTIANKFFVNPIGGFINNQQGDTYTGAFYGTGVIATNGAGGGIRLSGDLSNFTGTFDLENTNGNRSNQFLDLFGAAATTGGTTKFVLQSSTASPGSGGAGGSRIEYIGTGNATIPLGNLSGSVFGVVQDSTASTTPITTANYKIGGLNLSSTFAGVIEDNDGGLGTNEGTLVTTSNTSLEKTGTGVLNLTSANDYTGTTTIDSGGVLLENGTFASGGSFVASTTAGDRAYVLTTAGSTSGFVVGSRVSGVGIIPNTVVAAVTSTTVTLSQGLLNGGGNAAATVTDTGGSSLPSTSNLQLAGGILGLGSYGNLTRSLGTGAGSIQFTATGGGGGFAAYGADRTVNLGGGAATVTYGSGNFVPTGGALIFGASVLPDYAAADHAILFQNPIDLAGGSQTIQTNRGSGAVDGVLVGAITDIAGGGALTLSGNGVLQTNAANTFTGNTNINGGTLTVNADTTDAGTGYPGTASASLASSNVVVATGTGFHLITSLGTGAGGATVSLLSASTAVSVTGTGITPQVILDLNGNTQTISSFVLNGSALAPGYYGSATFFADTGLTDASAGLDDAFFSGDGGFNVSASTPEPGSVSIIGLGGLAMLRRRRRQA